MEWLKNQERFCLILANGEAPSLDLCRYFLKRAEQFIALDGAAKWALENQLKPDLIIGDLDSVTQEILASHAHLRVSEQDSNDLEKSLHYCLQQGFKRVLVLGAFGKRADHFLTNIFVLKKYASALDLIFADDEQLAFICSPHKTLTLRDMNNCYLSLFPLGNKVGPITTKGLQYALDNEELSFDERIGTLNKIVDEVAQISCESTGLMVLMPMSQLFYRLAH